MIRKLFRVCPICGFSVGEVLTQIELASLESESLPPHFKICLCANCKFCFDDIKATQDDFNNYYVSTCKYAQANTGGSGGKSQADMKRWSRVITILSSYLKKGQRVVDVGCGKGGLLLALRSLGFERLIGIEPSSGCRAELADQNVVSYSSVNECLRSESPFDCVICSQVLEHVFSLDFFLSGLKQLVAPHGIIYVEVPNAAGYSNLFHAPFYYFDREHINHFTSCSLDNLFAKALQYQPVFCMTDCAEPISGVLTPTLYAVYQACHEKAPLKPDTLYSKNIDSYVTLSESRDHYPALSALKSSTSSVLLWGYGTHLRRLFKKGVFSGLPVKGIIDRDKGGNGEFLSGYPILAPSAIQDPQFQDATIIITSVLYANQIHDILIDSAFGGQIIKISN